MDAHGTMIAVEEEGRLRFVLPAVATPHARIDTTILMFRALLRDLAEGEPALRSRKNLIIQFDDRAHHGIASVAFCRRSGEAPAVRLVPDPYFFMSQGYRLLRETVAAGTLPPWNERQDTVFWRGSATTSGVAADGSPVERLDQIPRVGLCLALREQPGTDAAIMASWGFWGFAFSLEEQVAYLTRERIFRPAVAVKLHAGYRYLIDIDGVASAWSFFEKMLLGSCILKVASPFEQWFYPGLEAGRHYVGVRADLSDLAAKIEWCREHPREARDIAAEAQHFARDHSFEAARQLTLEAIRGAMLVMDYSPTTTKGAQ